ncbi:RluA family pseudouridine synthase [uncultured Clostridium sp.]|uniref:RluA family pseudouridine synthase n=1 Tax=uncultured Clostridium sp. TaxID=59620 RepID=UPI002631EAC3|nr:RluA family pseudouridine synthase [uncultured Clostridium sp.]
METKEIIVSEAGNGVRADKYLSEVLNDLSRSFIKGLFDDGSVIVNDKTEKAKLKLKEGDKILISIPEVEILKVEAEDIPLEIIYEDSDIIVVNKPKGMVVHPAIGHFNGTLVNALLHHCKDLSGINGVARPGIVHRIDKDTSGILVVAKNDNAHNDLARQFKEHTIKREYVAIVEGRMGKEEGTIDAPLARHAKDRMKYAVVRGGKNAITHYKTLEVYNSCSLIKCNLETGRTHQIRVHLAFISHPLLGDTVYGLKRQKLVSTGQALHAKKLGFIHPATKKYIEFNSELPEYVKDLIKKFGGSYED